MGAFQLKSTLFQNIPGHSPNPYVSRVANTSTAASFFFVRHSKNLVHPLLNELLPFAFIVDPI